jgi:hypothetical protein
MPMVSVVVIVYNMAREAPRTLLSLSAAYQRDIHADDYEVIVVDNGSDPPFDASIFDRLEGNFRLIRIDPAQPSPAAAINCGLREAKGELIGVLMDGARLVTPGLLHFARVGASLYPRAVVATLDWYLGYDIQWVSMEAGYDQAREDDLLRSIEWPHDGYRLFDISTLDESSPDGWFSTFNESNSLFLSREFWTAMGGADERFDMPGGGALNLDTLVRALETDGSELVLLLGEATFHQLHGGIATNVSPELMAARIDPWLKQYESIRGRRFAVPYKRTTYVGTAPRPSVLLRLAGNAVRSVREILPLGADFDRGLRALEPPKRPSDPSAAAIIDIAHEEFRADRYASTAAVARLARLRFPDEPEPQRLLALVGPILPGRTPAVDTVEFHLALGRAHAALGDAENARAELGRALSLNPELCQAHLELAKLRMPGELYWDWLSHFHELLEPNFYVEIGVASGWSICRARPPTCAIGIDPAPHINAPFVTETHIFTETSNEFFARGRLNGFLGDQPLELAFIDGEHSFEQSLLDFINLERFCGPGSVVLLHDTYPLNEATQERVQRTQFYTGDVWKTVFCLKNFRPDLDIFTIATAWSGLTVVTGLDPQSRVLPECYRGIVEEFRDLAYTAVEEKMDTILNLVPNRLSFVTDRLQTRLARFSLTTSSTTVGSAELYGCGRGG